MKSVCKRFWILFLLGFVPWVGVVTPASDEESGKLVLAHYMPWYATKDVSGKWGWHWTMEHFDPDEIRWDGRREAASNDYPLIDLYDSGDADALECHALLMKFSGIDGVIVDWYGIDDFNDYAAIHRNTKKLISFLKKAGLRFAICYEDQSIGQMEKREAIDKKDAVAKGKAVFEWMEENWFRDDAYLKVDGRPVLAVFGPQYFAAEEWKAIRGGLSTMPLVFALPHLAKEAGADGPFGWPPVDGGKFVAEAKWRSYLEGLYARSEAGEAVMGVAFPGYDDIYKKAGQHESYGFIDARYGKTFAETLDLALESEAKLIQVATWNDYGEGTVVEPTWNFGYRYLEAIQERTVGKEKGAARFSAGDLRLPVTLYELRKRGAGDAETKAELDRAAEMLFASKCDEARSMLDAIRARLSEQPAVFPGHPGVADPEYRLATGIRYREGAGTTDYMRERCQLDVYSPAPAEGKPFATVVWFHGGGISKGHRSIPVPLREKGVAVVAVNYRLSPRVAAPAYIEDAAAAVAWTFRNIEKFGGSPDSIFVSGHSAGGYLASMVGLDKRWLAAQDIDADRIAGLIPFSGHTITHFTVRKERGIGGTQAVVDELAPLFHVRKGAPPMLLITGDRELELLGRYEETAYFWRMMQVIGHPDTALRELKGFDHGKMPEPAFPWLLEFVEEHLK